MNGYFTIEDLAGMSGLSTRTIRNYITSGQLEGEKNDGIWRFTPEQFGRFLQQDMVRQSVQAKANGIVYDFLLTERRKEAEGCFIWDIPVSGDEAEQVLREKLMERVNASGVKCAYRFENGTARAILTGSPSALAGVISSMQ